MSYEHDAPQRFEVQLPAGGKLNLQGADEVELWEESARRYMEDYQLAAQNDLLLLGAILSQQLAMFRAQMRMNGMVAILDEDGIPTGRYDRKELKVADMGAAQSTIMKASAEIRELEKALGIDKKTRESGGAFNTQDYIKTLKAAAREYGLHISKRTQGIEEFAMELRWRIRLLRHGDAEDRQYHDISESTIVKFCETELTRLEELDKEFAREKGKVFAGRIRG